MTPPGNRLDRMIAVTGHRRIDVIGGRRRPELCRARWAIMRALRAVGGSFPVVGIIVGRRAHTTVIHGLKRAEALYASDADFAALCDQVAAA